LYRFQDKARYWSKIAISLYRLVANIFALFFSTTKPDPWPTVIVVVVVAAAFAGGLVVVVAVDAVVVVILPKVIII